MANLSRQNTIKGLQAMMVEMSERLDALASTSKSRRDEREDMAGTAMVLEGTTEKSNKASIYFFYWMKLLISSTP